MPELKGGVFLTFEPGRRKALLDAAHLQWRFSVELSSSDWPLSVSKAMFLLSFSNNRDNVDGAGGWPRPFVSARRLVGFVGRSEGRAAGKCGSSIDELWARTTSREVSDRPAHIQRLALQRDAIGLSLDIAGLSDLRRDQFRKARRIDGAESGTGSFLDLMDSMQPHEACTPDSPRARGHPPGSRNAIFQILQAPTPRETRRRTGGGHVPKVGRYATLPRL